jgi:hypothetical protein
MMYRPCFRLLIAATAGFFWSLGATAEDASVPTSEQTITCDSEAHRQFDFWLGNWRVTEGGQPAGQNSIETDLKRCALFETWRSVDGSRGRSINFYDRNRQRWHQTWIDDRGGALQLDGGLVAGSMVLEGERPDAQTHVAVRHRITWTPQPDGSVRQHWQMLKSDQPAWETVFDGLYQREK